MSDSYTIPQTENTQRSSNETTCGEWNTEAEVWSFLDEKLGETNCFKVYKEVRGYYLNRRLSCDESEPRIDRLLVPLPNLLSAGWTLGAVGIECKKSGTKLGPVLAQCMDYSRAAFRLPKSGVHVVMSWVFLCPVDPIYGNLASVMAQHRIGEARFRSYNILTLATAGRNILEVHNDGRLTFKDPNCGGRAGSR